MRKPKPFAPPRRARPTAVVAGLALLVAAVIPLVGRAISGRRRRRAARAADLALADRYDRYAG